MEETVLISKVEKFLKEIEKDKISVDNLTDFESFYNLYFKLDDRLSKLLEFKDKMDAQGYTAPFRSLNRYGTHNVGEESIEERIDNSRHNRTFRTKANAKKNILDRVKSAIDSHRIAIGHLEEYGYVKCSDCYNEYRINEFKENDEKCSCGNSNFDFKINNDKAHRVEIIPYLPISGNYMVLRGELSDWGKESFNTIMNILKQERKGIVKTLSLKIRVKDKNNRLIRRNITLDSQFKDNYEEEVRRRYGKNVRIEQIAFYKTKPSIINDQHTRLALAIAYVKYSQEIVKQIKEPILKRNISDYQRLLKYDKIKYDINHKTPKFFENEEDLENWRISKINKEYRKLGYVDKYGKLNRSLNRDLKKKANIKKTIFANIAPTLIKWDIFKYYLSTSKNYRTKNTGPFPYIPIELDRQQRKTFEIENNKVIEALTEFTSIKIIAIPKKDLILYENFKIEKEFMKANLKNIYYPALGAALIDNETDLTLETIGNIFNVNTSKIKKETENINIVRGSTSDDSDNKEGSALADKFRDIVLKK